MTRTHNLNSNGWAYLPDDGRPPRLIRQMHIPANDLGRPLALYIHDKNLLLVDGNYFNALDDIDQGRVMATHVDLYMQERGGRISIR